MNLLFNRLNQTKKCKTNFLIGHYIFSSNIPTVRIVKKKFNLTIGAPWHDYKDTIIEFSLLSNSDEILDYMLADISMKFCADCLHRYEYKLTGKCNETYTKL